MLKWKRVTGVTTKQTNSVFRLVLIYLILLWFREEEKIVSRKKKKKKKQLHRNWRYKLRNTQLDLDRYSRWELNNVFIINTYSTNNIYNTCNKIIHSNVI